MDNIDSFIFLVSKNEKSCLGVSEYSILMVQPALKQEYLRHCHLMLFVGQSWALWTSYSQCKLTLLAMSALGPSSFVEGFALGGRFNWGVVGILLPLGLFLMEAEDVGGAGILDFLIFLPFPRKRHQGSRLVATNKGNNIQRNIEDILKPQIENIPKNGTL